MEDHTGLAKREMGSIRSAANWTADGSSVPMTSPESGWRADPLVAAGSQDQDFADGDTASKLAATSNWAPAVESRHQCRDGSRRSGERMIRT